MRGSLGCVLVPSLLLLFIFLLFFAIRRVLTVVDDVAKAVLAQVQVELVHQVLHELRIHDVLHIDLLCSSWRLGGLSLCFSTPSHSRWLLRWI